MEFLSDLWNFLKERKKWWLIPIVVVLLLLGILIVIATVLPASAPFVYTLF
jgi:competence protein ComGC